tara:strand:- start:1445 stop:1831 length:387 start_codon:yes stop_codon:yes gene_type:complete
MDKVQPHSKILRSFFFWSGIIATLAYRVIIVLNFYSPFWVKVSWYIGTVGFAIYFWHRYDIQKKRSQLVRDHKLVELVKKTKCANGKQKQALHYIVKTTLTSKAKYNSLFIFTLSILVLIIGIIMDVM